MKLLWLFATVLALLLLTAGAQKGVVHALRSGEHLVLEGRLEPDPKGRLQFMTVRTTEAFILPGRDGATIHSIALAGSLDYALLYRHRGDAVTIRGVIDTDDASPYYLNGTRLTVQSILTPSGTDLSGYPAATPMPPTTKEYRATALLPADLAEPWVYRADGRREPVRGWLSCSSNGGGDVVNCFCAEGFHAVNATGPGAEKPRLLGDTPMAQFEAGEMARRVELHVTCAR